MLAAGAATQLQNLLKLVEQDPQSSVLDVRVAPLHPKRAAKCAQYLEEIGEYMDLDAVVPMRTFHREGEIQGGRVKLGDMVQSWTGLGPGLRGLTLLQAMARSVVDSHCDPPTFASSIAIRGLKPYQKLSEQLDQHFGVEGSLTHDAAWY
jgi:hypothetical protein